MIPHWPITWSAHPHIVWILVWHLTWLVQSTYAGKSFEALNRLVPEYKFVKLFINKEHCCETCDKT